MRTEYAFDMRGVTRKVGCQFAGLTPSVRVGEFFYSSSGKSGEILENLLAS